MRSAQTIFTNTDSNTKNVLIIGGGIAGNSAALGLHGAKSENGSRKFNVTIADSRGHLGGHIDTIYFYKRKDPATGEYLFNNGKALWQRNIKELQADIADGSIVEEPVDNKYTSRITVTGNDGAKHNLRLFSVAEGGAEFIGPKDAYPLVHKLLQFLNLSSSLQEFVLSADLHNLGTKDHLSLPPFKKPSPSFWDMCTSVCNTELDDLRHLADLQFAIQKARTRISTNNVDSFLSLKDFLTQLKRELDQYPFLRQLSDFDDFATHVLYPLLGGSWGDSFDKVADYGVHNVMNYAQLGRKWFDAPSGLSTYVDAIERHCKDLDIRTNTKIAEIIPVFAAHHIRYKAKLSDGSFMKKPDTNEDLLFDEVINTTAPNDAHHLLPHNFRHADEAYAKDIREYETLLQSVEFYDTTLAFHLDEKYVSPQHAIVHVRIEADQQGRPVRAADTVQKVNLPQSKGPIMKSWVLPGQPMPRANVTFATRHYKHPRLNKAYFAAGIKLHELNQKWGHKFGYYSAGIMRRGDSHEDGAASGFEIAEAICRKHACFTQALNPDLWAFVDPAKGRVDLENTQLSTVTKEEAAAATLCNC